MSNDFRNLVRDWAARDGVAAPRPRVDPDLIRSIEPLRPRAVGHPLIRVGGPNDGGYLVPDDLAGIDACFSPGVGEHSAFERALADRYGIPCFLADHSVDGPAEKHPLVHFEKKYVGPVNNDVYVRLDDWVEAHAPAGASGDLLLQMDIEGAEYDVLIDTSVATLRRFRIVVIEIHHLGNLAHTGTRPFVTAILNKLTRHFVCAHVHPNNAAPVVTGGGGAVPDTMEFTFLRRDRIRADSRRLSFPHPLDRSNLADRDDVVLPEIWRPNDSG